MSSSRQSLARREPALPPVQGNGLRSAHPRDARRAELEARISQQRLDVSHALRELKEATAPIDRGWAKVQQYRGPLVLVGGLIAARGGFRPKKGLSLLKRGLMSWVMIRRLRILFDK